MKPERMVDQRVVGGGLGGFPHGEGGLQHRGAGQVRQQATVQDLGVLGMGDHGFTWPPPQPDAGRGLGKVDREPRGRVDVAQFEGLLAHPVAVEFVGELRQLLADGEQRLGSRDVRHPAVVVDAAVHRSAERRECLEQHLAVLDRGDLPGRQGAAVTGPDDVEVNRAPGVASPDVVDVHAVWRAARCRQAGGHECLPGDVTPDDVVSGIVELRRDEVVGAGLVDVQGRDDVGQRRRKGSHCAHLAVADAVTLNLLLHPERGA